MRRPKLWCPAPSAPANDAQDAAHHYSYVREADALCARLAELDPQCARREPGFGLPCGAPYPTPVASEREASVRFSVDMRSRLFQHEEIRGISLMAGATLG